MDQREALLKSIQDPDDRRLAAHAIDRGTQSRRGQLTHIGFLDPRQRGMLEPVLRFFPEHRFDLGEERALCLLLPDYLTDMPADVLRTQPDYPACVLRITLRRPSAALSHRDYLGTLMAQGVRRSAMGDIYVSEAGCVLPVLRDVSGHILANIDRVGGVGADAAVCAFEELVPSDRQVRLVRGTVASMRVDAVAGEVFGLSRTQAQEAVRAAQLVHNWMPAVSASAQVHEGDRLSLRGRGRVRILQASGLTRKGKIPLEWEVYV